MRKPWPALGVTILVAMAVGSCPALVWGAAAQINWSTYLRSGPGMNYLAIDELRHGALVDLASCAARWCKVSDGGAVGYVDRDSLSLPATPPGGVEGAQTCFKSALTSYKGPASNLFCAAALTAPTAP